MERDRPSRGFLEGTTTLRWHGTASTLIAFTWNLEWCRRRNNQVKIDCRNNYHRKLLNETCDTTSDPGCNRNATPLVPPRWQYGSKLTTAPPRSGCNVSGESACWGVRSPDSLWTHGSACLKSPGNSTGKLRYCESVLLQSTSLLLALLATF